jgi:PAS domain S-box-containing protein
MLGKPVPSISESTSLAAELMSQLLSCALPDAIFVKDLRRRYVGLNAAECKLLGVQVPQEVIGKTSDRLVSARRARLWRQEETEVLVTGVPLIERVEAVKLEDGTTRWLSATKVPLRNSRGDVTGLFGTTRDITEFAHEERVMAQFIATISHELRTPVASIMGSVALVVSGATGALPAPASKFLHIARMNSERLLRLVNDILDLEKVQSGMMVFDMQPIDVRALIEEEIAANRSFAEPYGVTVRLDPHAGRASVLADPDRLAQVVSNLLSNAVRFSPSGAEVVVGVERRPGVVRICVRDHGPGIPEAFRSKIFDKFAQARSVSSGKGGTGLGLAIVKQIVARMNGDVDFEPADGGGTVFFVTLPELR